jgi:hypothetical protein
MSKRSSSSEVKQTLLFVNKKKQKNFFRFARLPFATGRENGTVQRSKSFLVLFFKKEPLSFSFTAVTL